MSQHIKFCSPNKENEQYTCFSLESLIKIANKYNELNTNKIKITNDKQTLWNTIRNNLSKSLKCKEDFCLLETDIVKKINDDEINYDTFKPQKPKDWIKNPRAWLSTLDINNVLLQYEFKYKNFEFIGPVPIDFDNKLLGECISNELCKLNLDQLLQKGKDKIGVVFNLDAHNQAGSHWVSLFVDLLEGGIYYFDSVGNEPVFQIKKLMNRIRLQGNNLLIKNKINTDKFSRKYSLNYNNIKVIKPNILKLDNKVPEFIPSMILEYYCSNDKSLKIYNTQIIDVKKNYIYVNKNINSNCKEINIYGFRMLYNDIPHQQKNTECGTYSINFIKSILEGDNYENYVNNIIRDDEINSFRNIFYRPYI